MELSAGTRIDDLLNKYPFLMDFLIKQSPKFKLLQSTVMRKTVGKVATLAQAASIGDLATDKLISDIAAEIRAKTGEKVMVRQEVPESGSAAEEKPAAGTDVLKFSTGHLSPAQVELILTHLPVEISFVNERDEVEYYSQLKEKLFPRSPGIIGRRVQDCHPPKSVPMVQKILDEFRAGTKNSANFWLEMKGRFIYVRYYAVRDASGAYRGTMEVVQDVTDIRNLSGQKKLLYWD
ncbi:MAG: PAS domain-containing protein [Nitrospirae bacterium]|nr:PAS domain-containing protein [Nitrospirota bacterium]